MKKLFLAVGIVASISISKAQVYIQGGVNLANITQDNSGRTEENNMLTTFNAGFLSRFDISKTVDLESGVLVQGHGSKAETYFTASRAENYVKTKFNPIYIEVPLNLVVRVPIQGKKGLFFHAGPYVAIGVAGKSKSEQNLLGIIETADTDIEFSNDDPFRSGQDDAAYYKLKRFDLGLNLGGGFDFGKIMLKANYGYGFSKINSTETNNSADDKNKYRTLSFSVGIPLMR